VLFCANTLAFERPPPVPRTWILTGSPSRGWGALSRLRAGEVIAGLGGAALLGCARRLRAPRLACSLAGLSGIVLAYSQATRRPPALPAALSVVVTALGTATVVALSARVVRTPREGPDSRCQRQAAQRALLAALATALGGYASLRQEGGTDPAELGQIETITLAP